MEYPSEAISKHVFSFPWHALFEHRTTQCAIQLFSVHVCRLGYEEEALCLKLQYGIYIYICMTYSTFIDHYLGNML